MSKIGIPRPRVTPSATPTFDPPPSLATPGLHVSAMKPHVSLSSKA